MLKRLQLEAVRADLAAVDAVLGEIGAEEDPVGWLQFSQRKRNLEETLQQTEETHVGTAAVGLFFAGRPVLGSRGIVAEFGGKALEQFQEVVATRYASLHGPLGARGPIGQREKTQLMITDVARGSFGFVLEELNDPSLVDTPLKNVLDEVLDLVYKVSAPEVEAFESAAESLDDRVLGSLGSFFKLLDTSGAVLRLVDAEREFSLPRDAIERARERIEGLSIIENQQVFVGVLYLLPEARKFELHTQDGDLRGNITKECLATLTGTDGEVHPGIIGTQQEVTLQVRVVQIRSREPRSTYTLVSVNSATNDAADAR